MAFIAAPVPDERPSWADLLQLLEAGLEAADPVLALRRCVRLEGDQLHLRGKRYDLRQYRRLLVIGAGKASAAMAAELERLLGQRVSGGVVITRYGYAAATRRVLVQEAGHPVPDPAGLLGTRRLVRSIGGISAEDLVIVALSGGGSALMTLPVAGVTLADLQSMTNTLLQCGATINEINALRKHVDQVKGGGLARLLAPATVITLVLSDVVGDPLDVIASGPTVADESTFGEAAEVLSRYDLWGQVPAPVADHIRAGAAGRVAETPKPGDAVFARTFTTIIGNNVTATAAATERAAQLGYDSLHLTSRLEGEAREVGRVMAGIGRDMLAGRPVGRPGCVVAGGETTVTLRRLGGQGGRNQELALAAALALEGCNGLLFAALATDGSDGPTDAAGAIVDGSTLARGKARHLDARQALERHDAYPFFQALGDAVMTGPTLTNVNDLVVVLTTPTDRGDEAAC